MYNAFGKGAQFDPVKIPDKSSKILAQGKRYMEGEKELIKDNAAQTKAVVAAFDQAAKIERT